MRDLFLGGEELRLTITAMPGFARLGCENLAANPIEVSIAAAGSGFRLLSTLPPVALPGWGEHSLVAAYEASRPALLEAIAITNDGRDTLLARASAMIPVAASNCLTSWGTWARAFAWLPPTPLDQHARSGDVTRGLEVFGITYPVEHLPPEYDAAWACPAIPALLAVGPARCDLFTADSAFAHRWVIYAADGETPSRRRALVQVGIAIAKVMDLIDINWELADILTTLGEIGRLLPQAGVPANAVAPLMQIITGSAGRKVEDLDKPAQAALSRGIGRLERLAIGGGPTHVQEAGNE